MTIYLLTQKFVGYTKTFYKFIGIFNNKANALNHLRDISANYLNKSTEHNIQFDGDLKCFYYVDNSQSEIKAPYFIISRPLNHIFKNSDLIE